MSMPQDNPFKKSDDPVYVDGPPQSSSKKGCLIGCGIVGLIGLLVCCGGFAYFGIYGPSMVEGLVNQSLATEFQPKLAADPSIQEQIGEIQSLEFDFTKTIENAQAASEAGTDPPMAFRIQGSAGSGMVYVVQDKSAPGGFGIKSGRLVLEDGTEYPLDVEAVNSAASGSLQINLDDMIDDGNLEPQAPPSVDTSDIDPGVIDIGPIDLNSAGQDGDGVDNVNR